MKYGTPEYRAWMRVERQIAKEHRQAQAAAERQARIERENSGKVVVVKRGDKCKREVTVNGKSIGFAVRDDFLRFGMSEWRLLPHGAQSIECDSLNDLRQKAAEVVI
jgi:hypothetical protein